MNDTININGMGDVPAPSALREEKDGRSTPDFINSTCPVCGAGPYTKFSELRGHFGHQNDARHRAYDLSLDEFKSD